MVPVALSTALRRQAFSLFLLVLTLLWLSAVPAATWTLAVPADGWRLRATLIYGTGVLAMGCMSAAMSLAARPVRLESMLGGLDQFYRLHKRLGIAGAVFGIVHWLLEITPRWLVGQGWIERPARRGPPAGAGAEAGGIEAALHALREPAAEVGEWALYLTLALVVVALWRRIPYRHFAKLHRVLPVAYLALVFHSVVFMPITYWTALPGPVLALLMAGGTAAGVLSLTGRIGFERRALGHVESLRLHDDRVLEVHCALDTAWEGHEAGQFVFVTFDRREGAHPFTVASAWRGDGQLVLAIKALGDYTSALPRLLHLGSSFTIEGPYGRFNFVGSRTRQVWVGGGIGITPFIARMEALGHSAAPRDIDLFFSTDEPDDALFTWLKALAARCGVALHIVVPPRDGFLTAERIAAAVPGLAEAEVWFCGPTGFAHGLVAGLKPLGVPPSRFHREAFEIR
ncbi:MAG: ferric reductase-like transmembrane domain-containing protein [Rhizobacter sp.]